jgi:hypothetical protein
MSYRDDEWNVENPTDCKRIDHRSARLIGLFQLVVGSLAGIVFIVLPLREAFHEADEIYMSFTGVMVSLLVMILGLTLIIFGRFARCLVEFRSEEPSVVGVLAIIAIGTVAVAGTVIFQRYLETLGYDI